MNRHCEDGREGRLASLFMPHMSFAPATLTRREAIRRILAASALAASLDLTAFAVEDIRRIGEDPNLLTKEIPWPRILTDAEKQVVTALSDIIVPADEFGPAASAVGVTDFIDEWVSAPYDTQVRDREVIRGGLSWIDAEATKRFGKGYASCNQAQQTAIVQDIVTEGTEARKGGLKFFRLFRDRVAGGYYSTQEGWKAIGYMGNVPIVGDYPGPPEDALKHIGVV